MLLHRQRYCKIQVRIIVFPRRGKEKEWEKQNKSREDIWTDVWKQAVKKKKLAMFWHSYFFTLTPGCSLECIWIKPVTTSSNPNPSSCLFSFEDVGDKGKVGERFIVDWVCVEGRRVGRNSNNELMLALPTSLHPLVRQASLWGV